MNILEWIIVGIPFLLALAVLIIGIKDGTLFEPETDKERVRRYAKKFNRKIRRQRFRLLWPEDENQDMFGNPM